MEKQEVLSRLRTTLAHMKELDETQFYYGSFCDTFDYERQCGTVCCIAGHYPNWGLGDFCYKENNVSDMDLFSIEFKECIIGALMNYHGLSEGIIGYLFYGSPLFFEAMGIMGSVKSNCSLSVVITRFEFIYKELESGTLQPDFSE